MFCILFAVSAFAQETFSAANTLLFRTNHFSNIEEPTVLTYHYVHQAPDDSGFDDQVLIEVVKILENGGRNLEMEFFSGERKRYIPPLNDMRGNPTIMLFLQNDVNEMARETDLSWRHFQKSIKFAFIDGAEISPVEFEFEGKQVNGKDVVIRPFADDPQSAQMGRFAGKTYSFRLSDEVPGALVQILSTAPATEGGEVLLEDRLQLRQSGLLESGS